MPRSRYNPESRHRLNLILVAVFLAVAFLFGGASRADVPSAIVVRLAAILLLAYAAVRLTRDEWREVRRPVLFLIACALLVAVQLIPLPYDLWASMPGHQLYAEALRQAGIPPAPRPMTLTPDLGLNALLAFLPPIAMALALATVDRQRQSSLVPMLLAGAAISGVIGLVQTSSGRLYFYDVTNIGSAVGTFSNRNHLAAFLACAFPMLACWAMIPNDDAKYRQTRSWLALCGAAAIFPFLLVTGSRAGLLLGAAGLAIAAAMLLFGRRHRQPLLVMGGARAGLLIGIPVLIGIVAIAGALWLARDVALQRAAQGMADETRFETLPVFARMIGDYFPYGTGFGAFDSVYRAYEPHEMLFWTYLNHAHNDLAEILIEGGAFAAALLALFLLWYLVKCWKLWTRRPLGGADLLGRTGSAVAALLLLSSLVDYPLRTPFLAVLMAMACVWMERAPAARGRRSAAEMDLAASTA